VQASVAACRTIVLARAQYRPTTNGDDIMPRSLTDIDEITIHPGDGGVSVVSVWFTEERTPREKVTFNPYDIFDYRLFCSRVLEVTGHAFYNPAIEDAPDAWQAEMRWRQIVREKLESAVVETQYGAHWKPLIS
jgi:hypothetical protein